VSTASIRSFRAKSRNAATESSRASLVFARDKRASVLALSSLLLIAAAPQTAIEAEREFAKQAQTHGMWTAFRATAAEGALMFVPDAQDAQEWLKGRKDPLLSYMWWPAKAFVSCDGKTAATTGPSVLGATRGYFTTIWELQADGQWKWVLDHGDGLRTPRPAGEKTAIRRASCVNAPKEKGRSAREEEVQIATPRPYMARDRTLTWDFAVGAAGDRHVRVLLWNGKGYDVAIDDRVAPRR
jgi:hypothetical protein